MVVGRRVYNLQPHEMQPGDYGLWGDYWWVYPPKEHSGPGCLKLHTVVEHEDKTITVTPSILISEDMYMKTWHGFLTKGEWNPC